MGSRRCGPHTAESGPEAPAAVRNLSPKGSVNGKGNAETQEFPCEL